MEFGTPKNLGGMWGRRNVGHTTIHPQPRAAVGRDVFGCPILRELDLKRMTSFVPVSPAGSPAKLSQNKSLVTAKSTVAPTYTKSLSNLHLRDITRRPISTVGLLSGRWG